MHPSLPVLTLGAHSQFWHLGLTAAVQNVPCGALLPECKQLHPCLVRRWTCEACVHMKDVLI